MIRLGRVELATRPAEFREGWRVLRSTEFWRSFRDYWSPAATTERISSAVDRWLLDVHHDRGDGRCWAHREAWPCREVERVMERHPDWTEAAQ